MNPVFQMEPVKLSQFSKSASVRKIVHDDATYPKGEVICWSITSNDRVVYVDAKAGEVCLYLPEKYDLGSVLTVKRLYTSQHNVYIKGVNGTRIEGEEGTYLDDEDSFINLRLLDGVWHAF